MKKKVIILSMALMLLMVGVVSAAANWGKFEGYNIVKLVIDGKEVVPKDTPPVILKGRTMVPLAMLEQAGVTSVWDANTYTVIVETKKANASNDIENMKDDVYVLDFFNSLMKTGDRIEGLGSSFNTAFRGIVDFNDRSALDDVYGYFDGAIEQYNYFVDLANEKHNYFSKNETDDITSILFSYFDSIEKFRAGFNFLENEHKNRNNEEATDLFFKNLTEGSRLSYEGMNLASENYHYILRYIMNK